MTEEEERKARFKLDCFKEANETMWGARRLRDSFKLASLMEDHMLGKITPAMFNFEIDIIDEELDKKRIEDRAEIFAERAAYEQSEREAKND